MHDQFAMRLFVWLSAPLLSFAAAGLTSALAGAALPDKTLVYCSEASPAGFDSAQYTTSVEASAAAYTAYNRLVEFRREGPGVEPGLAESWDISGDGRQYTFHLRHGVKFQTTSYFKPTREFNADDVVFTYQRMFDPEQSFRKAYPVQFPYFRDLGLAKNISLIEALDPYTASSSRGCRRNVSSRPSYSCETGTAPSPPGLVNIACVAAREQPLGVFAREDRRKGHRDFLQEGSVHVCQGETHGGGARAQADIFDHGGPRGAASEA